MVEMTRKHIRGQWGGLSIRTISELMGLPIKETKNIMYRYGKARKNTLTLDFIGGLVWEARTRAKVNKYSKKVVLRDIEPIYEPRHKGIREYYEKSH
jgi:hypothetical protein